MCSPLVANFYVALLAACTLVSSIDIVHGETSPNAEAASVAANSQTNVAQPSSPQLASLLEKLGNERLIQLEQQLLQLQQLQQQQANKPDPPMMMQPPSAQIASPYSAYLAPGFVPNVEPVAKRAGHSIQQRAINQFKNCYFSPVQCVLLERRRRAAASSFA